jgi:hypothetical protein
MEEKFHLLVALTRLVTVNDWNIDTYYFISEPTKIQVLTNVSGVISRLFLRLYCLFIIYVNGHGIEAAVANNIDSSMNRYIERVVLLPEIKRRFANHITA